MSNVVFFFLWKLNIRFEIILDKLLIFFGGSSNFLVSFCVKSHTAMDQSLIRRLSCWHTSLAVKACTVRLSASRSSAWAANAVSFWHNFLSADRETSNSAVVSLFLLSSGYCLLGSFVQICLFNWWLVLVMGVVPKLHSFLDPKMVSEKRQKPGDRDPSRTVRVGLLSPDFLSCFGPCFGSSLWLKTAPNA